MENIDLNEMSLQDLKALEKNVAKAIKSFEARHIAKARAELKKHAESLGVSLERVLAAKPQSKKTLSPPKYKNPDDPSITWSGRGRKPHWFVDALKNGASEESLKI